MTTIPNHLALVPFNDRQYAAAKAILFVENKIQKGQYQKRYLYASALIRFFTGNKNAITAKDLHSTFVLSFDDKREMPSKNRYLAALDTLILPRCGRLWFFWILMKISIPDHTVNNYWIIIPFPIN
ncbi:plasmid SOS inhibition protein A [Providencia rettgeri]|uniref:hypothetical protein n=1 Tax=Providencia TaxID=586 RepID=UPI002270BDB3|nr:MULTISPECIES: hypothetical protein [Providencia]MCX9097547.1 plasmid SOS inhibition protein A [Providencia rettgeri]HCT9039584.1 plasmid SOS inhibition protein A [Providencia rettgeri]